jgi:hypothetical protein
MAKTQLFSKLGHHKILKMTTVVNIDGLRDTKSSNDMIEYEQLCSFPGVIKCRNHLGPFNEIIHSYNNVSMHPSRVMVKYHEVNAPFGEWTNKNYRVERSRVISDLIVISLASVEFLDRNNEILKQ